MHDRDHFETGEGIEDELAHAPGIDQPFIAQHTQLLRQRGLTNTGQRLKLAHVALALGQLTQQQQAIFVGQRLEQQAGFGRRIAQQTDLVMGELYRH